MYPFIRMIWHMAKSRRQARLPLLGTHHSQHICMPWDIDFWMELNNGRTLPLYDLGRLPLAQRIGLVDLLREHKWGLTVAGSMVRYRRRIRPFARFQMRSRCIGWDQRFVYVDQSMWRGEECCGQAIFRLAVTDANGIVPTAKVASAYDPDVQTPDLPGWVQTWLAAEDDRPWPPEGPDPTAM